MSTLEVSDLTKAYGTTSVLEGISFTLRPGGCTALIGPNGAGKSTLVECIAGLRRIDHLRRINLRAGPPGAPGGLPYPGPIETGIPNHPLRYPLPRRGSSDMRFGYRAEQRKAYLLRLPPKHPGPPMLLRSVPAGYTPGGARLSSYHKYLAYFVLSFKRNLREPAAVFFTLVSPLILLVFFGEFVVSSGGAVAYFVPLWCTLILLTAAIFNIPFDITGNRDDGTFKRLYSTPVKMKYIVVCLMLSNILFALASMLLLGSAAAVIHNYRHSLSDAAPEVSECCVLPSGAPYLQRFSGIHFGYRAHLPAEAVHRDTRRLYGGVFDSAAGISQGFEVFA